MISLRYILTERNVSRKCVSTLINFVRLKYCSIWVLLNLWIISLLSFHYGLLRTIMKLNEHCRKLLRSSFHPTFLNGGDRVYVSSFYAIDYKHPICFQVSGGLFYLAILHAIRLMRTIHNLLFIPNSKSIKSEIKFVRWFLNRRGKNRFSAVQLMKINWKKIQVVSELKLNKCAHKKYICAHKYLFHNLELSSFLLLTERPVSTSEKCTSVPVIK